MSPDNEKKKKKKMGGGGDVKLGQTYLFTPRVLSMQMWHFPGLPQIYSPVFIFLHHICS